MPLAGLEDHLGYWMRKVSNRVSGEFKRALLDRQTSVAEWAALRHIADRHEITPAALADTLGLTRGAVSKILDKLETKRWIRRAVHADDNRVQLLTLTAVGTKALPVLASIADKNDETFFGRLTTEDRRQLARLLRKLADLHELTGTPVD